MGFGERITQSRRERTLLQTLAVSSLLIVLVLYVGVNQDWFEYTNAMSLIFSILLVIGSTALLLLGRES